MVRSEAEKRSEDEKNRVDQTALKEYVIKMEENQRALLSRLDELEVTLEGDSQTSIGLLDMLLRKISSGGDNIAGSSDAQYNGPHAQHSSYADPPTAQSGRGRKF